MRLLAAVLGLLALLAHGAPAETYVVLPFANNSDDQTLDWLGESMAESISDALASAGALILARDDREEAYRRLSIKPYRPMTKASAIRIAESLDADQVILGSFELLDPENTGQKSRGTLRIHGQVIDTKKSKRGPEYEELGRLEDLAQLENHLAWETLRLVAPSSAGTEDDFRKAHPVTRVDAIESYTRGVIASSPEQKIKLLSQAVKLDPNFSKAWFTLGRLQWERKDYRNAAANLARVTATEPHYREAQFFLGISRYMLNDFAGAQAAFTFVVNQVPLNEVYNNLGAAQSRANPTAAIASFRKAVEGDPNDADYHFNLGLALFRAGQFSEAAQNFRAALDRRADDEQAKLMLSRSQTGAIEGKRTSGSLDVAERLKQTYEESAYMQLKAVIEGKR